MGSFKALLLAGVASLAAMSTASAADLLLPPPPPVAPAFVPIDFGGSFYLRGDVGVGISESRQKGSTITNASVLVPDLRYETNNFEDQAFVDFGVGYKFNNHFRADVTGEYRTAAHFGAIESYNQGAFNNPPDASRGYDVYKGSISSAVGLVNGYVDLGTWWCLTPYVGAGIGITSNNVSSVTDLGAGAAAGGLGFSQSHSQISLAYAFMAGVGFAVTPNTKIELGYRYLNLGNASSGAISCQNTGSCPYEVQHYRLASQDIRLGVRYMFNDNPPPAQYPLVRKY